MELLRKLFTRQKQSLADHVAREVQARLGQRVPPLITAQAKARALRRIAQGQSPDSAVRIAVNWALHADHGP